jgi:hypothetical protein
MLRGIIAAAASTAVLLAVSSAGAQETGRLGQKSQLIFSADRLVPLFAYNANKENNTDGSTSTTTQSSFSLLPNFNNFVNGNFYNVPRVGVDFAVIENLTIGGSVILYFSAGGSVTDKAPNGASVSHDTPSYTLFGFAPRVGYTLHLSDLFTFWPRGGFSYYTFSAKTTDVNGQTTTIDKTSQNQFAIDLEPMFALTPVQNFFFFFGPVIDIPLSGSVTRGGSVSTPTTTITRNDVSTDTSQFHFGATAGLGGYINL